MKLEVVNPLNRSQMCVGAISCVYDRNVLAVNIDVQGDNTKFLFHLMDCELFPLGWSKSTGHPIVPPHTFSIAEPKIDTAVIYKYPSAPIRCQGTEKITIYLNHKCFTGPFLSKSKLASLPKQVGPGPVKLVLLDVVKRLAHLAYVQMRILRELEAPSSKPLQGRSREELKVKFKKRVYKGTIEVATRLDTVESYCLEICKKLQVCSNLISVKRYPDCPLNCSERNKVKAGRDKKTNTKQPIDYKSFIYKPLTNPVTLVNRTPFQVDTPPPRDISTEDTIVWYREKCLRKRKVNVFLEREKKRLKMNDDEETGSSKGKESEENNSGEEEVKKRRGRPPVNKLDKCDNRSSDKTIDNNADNKVEDTQIYQLLQDFERKKVPLPKEANPLKWTADEVFQCVSQIPEIRAVAPVLKAEAIDGFALTLLNMHDCLVYLKLDADTSGLMCAFLEKVRLQYYVMQLNKNKYEDVN